MGVALLTRFGRTRRSPTHFAPFSPRSEVSSMALSSLVWLLVFASYSQAYPTGSPQEACQLLRPQHNDTIPQTSASPTEIIAPATYTPGTTIQVSLQTVTIPSFRGFMIQARSASDPNGSPLGSFSTTSAKSKTLTCVGQDDTVTHANRDLVSFITVTWRAAADIGVTEIKFYYTVVQNFTTYWVMTKSPATVRVSGQPAELTTQPQPTEDTSLNTTALIKAHASVMTLAWGLVAPVGIILAMFYKVVWPNGEWFYAHIAIMSTTLLFTIVGIVLIVVHSGGTWLNTTELNLPHQVLGIVVCAAVAANPFLAIIRCDPQSQWRWAYNWTHGSIGFILGQTVALAVMLLGLNIYRHLAVSPSLVHFATYTMSAIVGMILLIIALYNLYAINYHKSEPKPTDLAPSASEPPGSFPEHRNVNPFGIGGKQKEGEEEELEEELEPTRDYPLRAGVGIVVIVLLALLAVATIVLLVLA